MIERDVPDSNVSRSNIIMDCRIKSGNNERKPRGDHKRADEARSVTPAHQV